MNSLYSLYKLFVFKGEIYMRNSYIYLIVFLVVLMFILRFLIPIFIWLIPILIVIYILRSLKKTRHQEKSTTKNTYYHTESTYNDHDENDIIDVDYKVVDEKEQ